MSTSEQGNPAYPWHNEDDNPCVTCGACCAFFRVSFYGGECDDSPWGTVPVEMTENLTHHRRVMKGTNRNEPRCVALMGEIGRCVSCSIHPQRASVCREFPPSWENGVHHPDCDRAREKYGLPRLVNPLFQPVESDSTPLSPTHPHRAA